MLPNRIKYICYYDWPDSGRNRGVVLAATNLLDYIFECINSLGIGIDIISMAPIAKDAVEKQSGVFETRGNNTLKLFASSPAKCGRIGKVANYILWKLKFLLYLLRHIKRGDVVVVYHSMGYVKLVNILAKLKKVTIIGEVQEIYQYVSKYSKSLKAAEFEFFKKCDKYIFATPLIEESVNPSGKPSLIVNGTYKCEKTLTVPVNDGCVHLVYAGTFDPQKGCQVAVEAMQYLPENYVLHVCGFGNERDTASLKAKIEEVSTKCPGKVIFKGTKRGDDYLRLLQSCHIGLSPQDPEAAFNSTSFPSKILSYMANGLQVVSIRIPAIEQSNVGRYISFYDEQTPETIAKAIASTSVSADCSPRDVIKEIDEQFRSDLKAFLER